MAREYPQKESGHPVAGGEQEDLFRLMFEENNAVMLLFDIESLRFIDVNPAAAEFYGYSREKLRTLRVEAILARTPKEFDADIGHLVSRRMSGRFQSRHRLANGEVREVEVNATPLTIEGRLVMFSIVTDVTAEIRARQELAESESRLRTVVDSLPFDIWLCDAKGRYILQNRTSVDHWGNHVGRHPSQTGLPQEVVGTFVANNSRALAGEVVTGEVSFSIHGEPRTCFNILTPLRSPEERGPVVGIVGVNVDITDRIQAERQLRMSLEEKEVLLREVHHRVKNNLQVISSLLRLQADGIEYGPARRAFDDSQERIRAMASVHERLYHAQNVAEVDFGDYLTVMTRELMHTAGDPRITLTLRVEPVMLRVDTAVPCGLIVNELLTNVFKHAFPRDPDYPSTHSPTLLVELQRSSADRVRLIVEDNGRGFPEGVDFQAMTSMGMTLVAALARQLDGTISGGGSPGKQDRSADQPGGTRFVLDFPA